MAGSLRRRPMESTVEQRLNFLEARVKTLEGLLGLDAVPSPSSSAVPPAPPRARPWPEERAPVAEPKPPLDLEEIVGIGIVGALLAPVLVGSGTATSSLVFMTIALLTAIGVVVYRRWAWLAVVAYAVSVPQAASWLYAEHDHRLWLTLLVATAFWLLYVVAALGYEVRTPTESVRLSSASLLLVSESVGAAG